MKQPKPCSGKFVKLNEKRTLNLQKVVYNLAEFPKALSKIYEKNYGIKT
jgi:hypothetical protein